jgi:formamidopyrimidine-DNA glycosylase
MPELPEVETVCRFIEPLIKGKIIQSINVPKNYKKALVKYNSKQLTKILKNSKVLSVTRRAKFIIINLSHGTLCVHLRMTGRLQTSINPKLDKKYVTAWINFNDQSKLYFRDTRKFGKIYFYENISALDQTLGVEPLSKNFTASLCHSLLNSKKGQLKPILLNQKIIAGIGNIYADEILWATKLHPQKRSGNLSMKKCAEICKHTKRILNKSIKDNGTTFQSFYFGDNATGDFANKLKVFDRTDKNCYRCKTKIIKIRVAQRGTHLCPKCQKL